MCRLLPCLRNCSRLPIRPATPADLAAILALEQSASTAAHWSVEQYRAALSAADSRVALILEEDSQVLGFLIARAIGNEWELENIVVAATVQRRGLATQLIDELLNLASARHAATIFLEVRDSNLPARRLYEKRGFLECARRSHYYSDPQEDAVVYRLTSPNFASSPVQNDPTTC